MSGSAQHRPACAPVQRPSTPLCGPVKVQGSTYESVVDVVVEHPMPALLNHHVGVLPYLSERRRFRLYILTHSYFPSGNMALGLTSPDSHAMNSRWTAGTGKLKSDQSAIDIRGVDTYSSLERLNSERIILSGIPLKAKALISRFPTTVYVFWNPALLSTANRDFFVKPVL